MDNLTSNNKIIIGIAIVVIIIAGLWFMTRQAAAPSIEKSDTTMEDTSKDTGAIDLNKVTSTTSDTESVAVSNQSAGETVTISSVTFTQPGWVAVRDSGGWTLGAKRFDAGTYTDATVTLLRATTAGENYQALLYIDDGDKMFDLDKEILVTRSDGSIAGATFTTTE